MSCLSTATKLLTLQQSVTVYEVLTWELRNQVARKKSQRLLTMSSVCRLCWAVCIVILRGKSQGLDKGKELLLIYENIYLEALVSQSVSGGVNYYLDLQPMKGLQGQKEEMRWVMAGRYLLDHSNVCRAPNSYSGLDSSRREQEESISSHTKLILEPETFRPCSPLSFLLFLMFLYPPTIPFIFKCLLFAPSSPSVSACFHSNDVPRETQMELFISPLLSDIWEVFSTL